MYNNAVGKKIVNNIVVIEKSIQSFIDKFSSIFSIFDNTEIVRQLLQTSFESFLKTGITFAVLSINGKTRVTKERLNKSASCIATSFLRRNKIL